MNTFWHSGRTSWTENRPIARPLTYTGEYNRE